MVATMRQPTVPSVLFLATGIVFAVASLFASKVAAPSIDVLVHGTYLVIGHIHMLAIAALICALYSGLYYASARVLHLKVPTGLFAVHFAITVLALIGLGNMHYLDLGRGESRVYHPWIGPLVANASALLLISSSLFFGIIIFGLTLKVRRRQLRH